MTTLRVLPPPAPENLGALLDTASAAVGVMTVEQRRQRDARRARRSRQADALVLRARMEATFALYDIDHARKWKREPASFSEALVVMSAASWARKAGRSAIKARRLGYKVRATDGRTKGGAR